MSGPRKRQGLFLPAEQCLGGAMELNQVYSHYFHAQPKVVSQQQTSQPPTAQQLSLQRARKLAESDLTFHNHAANLHHLARRMAETRSSSATPWAEGPRRSATRHGPSPVLLMCPWLPATILANSSSRRAEADSSRRRPATAPGKLTGSSSSSSSSSRDSMTDWQQLKQRLHPEPRPPAQPVELPPSRFYSGPPLLPSVQHRLYKAAIMSDILQRQLYRARDIRALCDSYVEVNPLEHRELLRLVVAEVKRELDIKS